MLPSHFKAAASLDAYVDLETWAEGSPEAQVPYDPKEGTEVRVRNPIAFAASLRLYAGEDGNEVNALLEAEARRAGKDCELVVVPGAHEAMLEPAVLGCIEWFRRLVGR